MGEPPGQYPGTVYISQSPIGANSRSNPASYTGIMDDIRRNLPKQAAKAPDGSALIPGERARPAGKRESL